MALLKVLADACWSDSMLSWLEKFPRIKSEVSGSPWFSKEQRYNEIISPLSYNPYHTMSHTKCF